MPTQIRAKSTMSPSRDHAYIITRHLDADLQKKMEQTGQKGAIFSSREKHGFCQSVNPHLDKAEVLMVDIPQWWQACSNQHETQDSLQSWQMGHLWSLVNPFPARSPSPYVQSCRENAENVQISQAHPYNLCKGYTGRTLIHGCQNKYSANAAFQNQFWNSTEDIHGTVSHLVLLHWIF